MTNRQRTLLFMFLGTLFSVVLTFILFFLLLFLGIVIMKEKVQDLIPVLLILAFVSTVLIYQKLTVFIVNKWDLEDKLDPIFKSKKKKN